eukprot:TRINITY_DN1059_c0_g1_i7.p1 TRINITY_DN1059_c0_g1~~TRINITY_DN1059_c0_g1_i7.p1  ORF type:complete len:299 (-),score=35.37 TRINITY_DN1059_c0_g1_i7:399-1295(-)
MMSGLLIKRSFARFSTLNLASSAETFYARDLAINPIKERKSKPKFDSSLLFGHVATDHQLTVEWSKSDKWGKPQIDPFAPLQVHPFSSALHYAIQCFEGFKAYKSDKGKIILFRPEMNMKRMKSSCKRISLPDFDGKEFLECIKKLVLLDQDWIPTQDGFSLYIRPTGISHNRELGVRAPDRSLLFCVMSPVGPYYTTGFKPIKLYCSEDHIRAFPKGVGEYKLGSNYGPTIYSSKLAEAKGYNQVLWLVQGKVSEVGASNILIFWKNDQGEDELITPPLDGTILPGVTRDSILVSLQ